MMLGWMITVCRQRNDGAIPAAFTSPMDTLLATWETKIGGKQWLDDLAESKSIQNLGGNNYPSRYTAQARSCCLGCRRASHRRSEPSAIGKIR